MSVETWGQMAKSQVNNEKVEEAIDRIVEQHNDDPDAHLADGQSLTSHRASEIIDHLANSIIEDKIATGEISSRCITTNQIIGKHFTTDEDVGSGQDGVKFDANGLEMWQGGVRRVLVPKTGDAEFLGKVTLKELRYLRNFRLIDFSQEYPWYNSGNGWADFSLAGLWLASGSALNNVHYVKTGENLESVYNIAYGDLNFETCLSLDNPTHEDLIFGFNYDNNAPSGDSDYPNAVGFEYINQKMYAVVYSDAGTRSAVEVTFPVHTGFHRYRVNYVKDTRIDWFIDDVLVRTQSTIKPNLNCFYFFNYWLKTTSAAWSYVHVLYLTLESGYPTS